MENDNKTYLDNLINKYNPYQSNILNNLESINNFQSNLNFKKFYDITIAAINANTRTIKYFKENNIDFENSDIYNFDQSLMQVIDTYILHLYMLAYNEMNDYISSVNNISDTLINSFKYKLFIKINNPNIYNFDFRKYYTCLQYRLDNFYNYGEELYNFNIKTDIYTALNYYLSTFYKNLTNNKFNNDEIENFKTRMNIFHLQITRIVLSLKKLNLVDKIDDIASKEKEILLDDLNSIQNNYTKIKK